MVAQVREDVVEARPDDRCPYSRAFSTSFTENPACPAFQEATFSVTDTAHRSLGSRTTCRHLTTGSAPGRSGRFYPRCGLGAPDQRLVWLAAVTPGRLAVMRSLEAEFAELTAVDRVSLVDLKGRLLAAGHSGGQPVEQLEVELHSFLDRVDRLIDERRDRLADVGLPAERLKELLRSWSLAWLRSRQVGSPTVAEMRLRGFEAAAAAFLGGETAAVTPFPDGEVIAIAGGLTIARTADPPALLLRGEIDATNSDTVATAVAVAMEDDGYLFVDFRDVLFCDLTGLRALVSAAEAAGPARRIVVTGLSEPLRRVLGMVGWAELPTLVIAESPFATMDTP
jgi:anti-anti-sigma factor